MLEISEINGEKIHRTIMVQIRQGLSLEEVTGRSLFIPRRKSMSRKSNPQSVSDDLVMTTS